MRSEIETGHPALILLIGVLAGLAACGKKEPPPVLPPRQEPKAISSIPWFEEISAKAGLNFRHSTGHTKRFYMPEVVTGGVGLLDYDSDGLLDVFCVNGGSVEPGATNRTGHKLFHNRGGWRFEDVTEHAGLPGQGEYGMGCACGDYNGDGRTDLYVSHLRGGLLYRNNGDGTFTDVTRQAGLRDESWGTSGAFFDYDLDGHLDLVVANYQKPKLPCAGSPEPCRSS